MKQILPGAPEIFGLETWPTDWEWWFLHAAGIWVVFTGRKDPCLSMMPEYGLLFSHPKGYTLVFGHRIRLLPAGSFRRASLKYRQPPTSPDPQLLHSSHFHSLLCSDHGQLGWESSQWMQCWGISKFSLKENDATLTFCGYQWRV